MNRKDRSSARWPACAASLGSLIQGFITCSIAGALPSISFEFTLSAKHEGLIASIILLGALFGAALAGYLADLLGRRSVLLCAAILYILSAAPILWVRDFSHLLILRFISGWAVGITSLAVPLYLAEIAPDAKRGAFVTLSPLAAALGIAAGYLVNFTLIEQNAWRSMLAFPAILAAIQALALFFVPDAPFPKQIQQTPESQKSGLAAAPPLCKKEGWILVFSARFRNGLYMGISLLVFQQWCGINAAIYFLPTILLQTNFSSAKSAMAITLLIGIVNCLATLASLFLIDRLGRRTLLLLSQGGVCASLACLTFLPIGTGTAFTLGAFVLFFAFGLGSIPWIIVSEIYPLVIRAKMISIMTCCSWISTFLVVFTFPLLFSHLGFLGTFLIYTAIACYALWRFWRSIPETKQKSFEEIESVLYSKKRT